MQINECLFVGCLYREFLAYGPSDAYICLVTHYLLHNFYYLCMPEIIVRNIVLV